MSKESRETFLEALEEASTLLMIADQERFGPLMQRVRIQIGEVRYELFGAMVSRPMDQEPPEVRSIEFGEILPMQVVINWLQKAQEIHDRGSKSGMQ